MDSKMVRHYETVKGEATRLSQESHRVEFERTKEILMRYLPPPPAQILDLGGGPGAYAFWLAHKSYKVHLVDTLFPCMWSKPRLRTAMASLPASAKRMPDVLISSPTQWTPCYCLDRSITFRTDRIEFGR